MYYPLLLYIKCNIRCKSKTEVQVHLELPNNIVMWCTVHGMAWIGTFDYIIRVYITFNLLLLRYIQQNFGYKIFSFTIKFVIWCFIWFFCKDIYTGFGWVHGSDLKLYLSLLSRNYICPFLVVNKFVTSYWCKNIFTNNYWPDNILNYYNLIYLYCIFPSPWMDEKP